MLYEEMQGTASETRMRSVSEPPRSLSCSVLQSRIRIRYSELSYEQGKDVAAHSLGKWTSTEVRPCRNSKSRIIAFNTCDVFSTDMQSVRLTGIAMFAQSTAVSMDSKCVYFYASRVYFRISVTV